MDAELKAKWVAALRSGEYKQAQKRFREGDCFCCLGVLADVSDKGEWDECEYVIDGDSPDETRLDGDLGIHGRPLFGMDDDTETRLVVMNDDEGADFCVIADYIEARVK